MFETHNLERVSLVASDKKSAETPQQIPQTKTLIPTGRDYKRMSNAISCQ